MKLEAGKVYGLNIPPGWLCVGEVAVVDDEHVEFGDFVHLESPQNNQSPFTILATAKTGAELRKGFASYHVWAPGVRIRNEALLMTMPVEVSIKSLVRAADAETITEAATGRKR